MLIAVRTTPAKVVARPAASRVTDWIDRHYTVLFLLPGFLCLTAVIGYPALWNFAAAFSDASLLYDNWRFVGLGNFVALLEDADLPVAMLRTLVWTVASVALQMLVGLVAALCLERVTRGRGLLRTVLIVPWAFPAIIMAFCWRFMLDPLYGVTNHVLMIAGLVAQPVAWFGEADTAMLALVVMNVWFGFPFMMIAILAGLQTIPADLYEAARIDGASYQQELFYVTLPGLKGILMTLGTLRAIWVFNNFEFPYLTTGGGPLDATTTLPIFAFKIGWGEYDLGRMAAVSVLMIALLAVATAFYLKLLRHGRDA